MQGKMLWFNEEKEHGFILTDEGERLYVHRDGFSPERFPLDAVRILPCSSRSSKRTENGWHPASP